MQSSDPVSAGDTVVVHFYLSSSDQTDSLFFDGFELRVGYDSSLLSLWDVYSLQLDPIHCNWQLSYEIKFLDRPDFPTGLLWIRAISTEDSLSSENCFDLEEPLLSVQFLVREDADLSQSWTSTDFTWYNCNDNRFWNHESDTVLVAAKVLDTDGIDITDDSTPLPTLTGLPSECLESSVYVDTVLSQDITFRSTAVIFKTATDIANSDDVAGTPPRSLTLQQNYPNPFNPATIISFDLPRLTDWKIEIFNVLGSRIRTFVGRGGPGRKNIEWCGIDSDDRTVGSGIYLYRLTAGKIVLSRKMIMVR